MNKNNDDVIEIISNPHQKVYENGDVILIDPAVPSWLKTSFTGKWIFEKLKEKPRSFSDIVEITANNYNLPIETVKNSVASYLNGLIDNNFAELLNKPNQYQIIRKKLDSEYGNDHLLSLGLVIIEINIISNSNKQEKFISERQIKKILDQSAELDVKRIIISGNDPLNFPALISILKHAKGNSNLKITLCTSGHSRNKEYIKQVLSLIDNVRISFSRIYSEVEYTNVKKSIHQKSIDFIKIIKDSKMQVNLEIEFIPERSSMNQIPDFLKFGFEIGANNIRMNLPKTLNEMRYANQSKEEFYNLVNDYFDHFDELIKIRALTFKERQGCLSIVENVPKIDIFSDPAANLIFIIKKTSCSAGATNLFIDSNGDCYPCCYLTKIKLGNTLDTSLKEIYDNSIRKFRSEVSVENSERCKHCIYKFICAGGCRSVQDTTKEDILYCEIIKKRYEHFFNIIRLNPEDIQKIQSTKDRQLQFSRDNAEYFACAD